MQIKKTIGTSLLISVIVLHVTVRIMAKDAYVISTADYSSTKEVTPAAINYVSADQSDIKMYQSALGWNLRPQQNPIPY
ncbi:MAG TPA: hypothetical protein PKX04_09765 [Chitinophagales bacterium]|nr:hypothetical protein [Chitinophagales bacterium]HAE13217.1 hypothetical protein [Bacteroidota bacterium]MCB9031590.1 hypothetical protein [Chitinophagales bacterium]HAE35195.1 hypothetical protein [Bacteroidota bacterium]HPE98234.1 hypothetical protein [Chitinophagales bacterium]